MAQENNASQQLYDTLVTRDFDPKSLDAMGKPTVNPGEADLFSFNYKTENSDYGTVVILVNGDNDLEVFYGDNLGRGMERGDRGDWYDFLGIIRNIAKRNLLTFSLNNMNRLKYSMKSMAQLAEGWKGHSKTRSSSSQPGNARVVIQHSRALGEGEARFRNIESLFVENAAGERFRMPFKSIAGAKAMARHVSEGGNPYDSFGQHISATINEMGTLSRFIRASRSNAFAQNESALGIVEDAVKHYSDIKRKAKKMISRRGYKDIFAAFDPLQVTDLDETVDRVREVFVNSALDRRIEEALPILAKIQEENMKEADIFEQWADRITEGTWALPDSEEQMSKLKKLMSEPLMCGPDGEYATEQLYDLIGDDELFDDISALADRDPNADCRELVKARLADFDIVIDESMSEGAMSDLHQHIGEMIADGDSNEEIKKMHPGVSDQNINSIRRQMEESVDINTGKPVPKTNFMGVNVRSKEDRIRDKKTQIELAKRDAPKSGLTQKDVPQLEKELKDLMKEEAVEEGKKDDEEHELKKLIKGSPIDIDASGPMNPKKMKEESVTEDPTQEEPAQTGNYQSQQAAAATGKADSLKMGLGGDNDLDEANNAFVNPDEQDGTDDANKISNSEEQDLDDEDMTEVTDIDTGKTALKAERDPMLEAELDRLLQLARG